MAVGLNVYSEVKRKRGGYNSSHTLDFYSSLSKENIGSLDLYDTLGVYRSTIAGIVLDSSKNIFPAILKKSQESCPALIFGLLNFDVDDLMKLIREFKNSDGIYEHILLQSLMHLCTCQPNNTSTITKIGSSTIFRGSPKITGARGIEVGIDFHIQSGYNPAITVFYFGSSTVDSKKTSNILARNLINHI